jgi:hypothetical protein
VVAIVLTLWAVPLAQAAPRAKHESYPALGRQISSGQVRQATVIPKSRTVRVRLRSGLKYVATYPAGADPTASLRAHGARVRVAAHKVKAKSSGHVRSRYIVLAIVAALALAGGGAYILWRRRKGSGPSADRVPPAP